MADISADSLLPSGSFNPSFFSGVLIVASGAPAGTIISLTPPAGKKVRLTGLVSISTDAGITVNNGAVNVVSNLTLSTPAGAAAGNFMISQGAGTGNGHGAATLNYVDSYSSITVTKSGGATSNAIHYSYAYGD